MSDLSPVSALRLHFDQLPGETTDPIVEKNVFGVPVSQLVPQSVISWLDGTNSSSTQNDLNFVGVLPYKIDASQATSIGGYNDRSNIITRKVCFIHLTT